MVRLLEGIATEGIGHFRVSFPLGLAAHGKVHAHFRTFAREMVPQTGEDFFVHSLGNADNMLASPLGLVAFFFDFHELVSLGMADRAFCGRVFPFINVTADQASESLFHIRFLLML